MVDSMGWRGVENVFGNGDHGGIIGTRVKNDGAHEEGFVIESVEWDVDVGPERREGGYGSRVLFEGVGKVGGIKGGKVKRGKKEGVRRGEA